MGKISSSPEICYVDMGGTFTDAFIVCGDGTYGLGKAPSDPNNIVKALIDSIKSGAQDLNMTLEELLAKMRIIGYGSTITINALLTGRGKKAGMLITQGISDVFLIGRGKQTWIEFTRKDRMHPQCHRRAPEIIQKSLIREIPQRVDSLGKDYLPLDEQSVKKAVQELIDLGIESLAIAFMYSYLNDSDERRAAKIADEVIKKSGKEIPIYLSVDVNPVVRELSRFNSTAIEARTAGLLTESLKSAEDELRKHGYKGTFQVMQSTGGLSSVDVVKSVETVLSGPVGGIRAGQFIGDIYGLDNVITTDVGGTSFDVGIISHGQIRVNREPSVARYLVGIPIVEVFSIGAGGGTIAKIDPYSNRMVVGPESAGAIPGPACYDRNGTEATVTDADLVLGYIDPDYFLGGKIKLNKKRAVEVLKKRVAEPLGIDVIAAATGVKSIIDLKMRENIVSMITSRGFNIPDYTLLAGGGGGPTHAAGYTNALNLKGVAMFPYSSVFSAFGASSSDYEHHYTYATVVYVPLDGSDEDKVRAGRTINDLWEMLEQRGLEDMKREGFGDISKFRMKHLAMLRYGGQLNDLIVESPVSRINTADDWDNLVHTFESLYEVTYTRSAKYSIAGYQIFEVGLAITMQKIKPTLVEIKTGTKKPSSESIKQKREAFFDGEKTRANVYNWSKLLSGNIVDGPAIIESSTTTCVLPPERRIEVDKYGTFWVSDAK